MIGSAGHCCGGTCTLLAFCLIHRIYLTNTFSRPNQVEPAQDIPDRCANYIPLGLKVAEELAQQGRGQSELSKSKAGSHRGCEGEWKLMRVCVLRNQIERVSAIGFVGPLPVDILELTCAVYKDKPQGKETQISHDANDPPHIFTTPADFAESAGNSAINSTLWSALVPEKILLSGQ